MPADNSADIARQKEQERQANITSGRSNIDTAFAPFDDKYFNKVSTDYSNYYDPQLDQQYNDARRKLVLQLSGTGNLNSGSGARQIGALTRAYEDQRQSVAGQAIDASTKFRGQVEQNRNDLYNQNISAADPAQAATSAATMVGSLQAPRAYSPLGDVFGSLINSAVLNSVASRSGPPSGVVQLFGQPSRSAATVVS